MTHHEINTPEIENDTILRLSNAYRQNNAPIEKPVFPKNTTTKHYIYLPNFIYRWLGWRRFNAMDGSGWHHPRKQIVGSLRYDRPYFATASPVYVVAVFMPVLLIMGWSICNMGATNAKLKSHYEVQQNIQVDMKQKIKELESNLQRQKLELEILKNIQNVQSTNSHN